MSGGDTKPRPLDYRGTPTRRPKPPPLGRTVAAASAFGLFGGLFAAAACASYGASLAGLYLIFGIVAATTIGVVAVAHAMLERLPVFWGEVLLLLAAYFLGWSWVGVGGALWQVARFGLNKTNVSGYVLWGFAYGLLFLPLTYAMLRGSLGPLLAWRRRTARRRRS